MTGAAYGAGHAYLSGAPDFIAGFHNRFALALRYSVNMYIIIITVNLYHI